MAKKSKSKNSGGNTSNAKNIKALINQNKMVVQQNAEAERRKKEEQEAREAAKREKEERLKAEAQAKEAAKVEANEVIAPDGKVEENKTKTQEKDAKADAKTAASKKDAKGAKKKVDPERRTMKKRIKETISELKKVSWPSFKDVVKKTGVVLAVVIFFGIVLWIFDFALNIIYKLLQGQPPF